MGVTIDRKRRNAVVLFLLVGFVVFRLVAGYVEGRIATRLTRAATSAGVRLTWERLHVGLFPPFQMSGLVIDKPGKATIRIEGVSVRPRLYGPRGFALLGRVSLAAVKVDLPADMQATLRPTVWEVDPKRSVTLEAPVAGLEFTTTTNARGRAFHMAATRLSMDALGALAVEGGSSKQLGAIDGSAHAEGDPRRDFQGTWRFRAFGGETGGSFIVLPDQPDAKVQFQSSMKGLDFAHILRSLGVDAPQGTNALGSLSGTISVGGRMHDPATLEVIQRIDFKRPEKAPPEVARLRGGFVHEVTTNSGAKRRIDVSPGSADYIAGDDVPPLFTRALLIAEDSAFFGHPGIDLTELPKAIAVNIARGGAVRGASTITQQLAKNLFLTREKSLHRKLRELSYAFLLESTLGKRRILEIYVNIIEWGPGLYGLRPAARHYFDKEPQALTPREIAFLVSMIPGPVKYQRSIQGGELRRGMEILVNNLLTKVRSVDAITEEEFARATSEPLVFRGAAAKEEAEAPPAPSASPSPSPEASPSPTATPTASPTATATPGDAGRGKRF